MMNTVKTTNRRKAKAPRRGVRGIIASVLQNEDPDTRLNHKAVEVDEHQN
jgi:hypothetical protein